MKGVYQHCREKHLHRYLAEFDFRYSFREANGYNDKDYSVEAMKGIVDKRLTYWGVCYSATGRKHRNLTNATEADGGRSRTECDEASLARVRTNPFSLS